VVVEAAEVATGPIVVETVATVRRCRQRL
jgi:hypothetical protein